MSGPDAGTPDVRVLGSAAELAAALAPARQAGRSVGFVPTMGYLHAGHAELIRRARAENDVVVLSVFVNPTQFAPGEDLDRYPRDLQRDLAVAREAGADLLFHPTPGEMYPAGHATAVSVAGLSTRVEGASRPGHFGGVATVVLKLLNLVRPQRLYLGEKDWQQLAVVRRMVTDLFVPVQVVGVPTVRGPGGLALSSRNSYLSEQQQQRAGVIHAALQRAQQAYAAGRRDADGLRQAALEHLASEPVELDYLQLLDADLEPLAGHLTAEQAAEARLVFAGRLFGVRLIDNLPLVPHHS